MVLEVNNITLLLVQKSVRSCPEGDAGKPAASWPLGAQGTVLTFGLVRTEGHWDDHFKNFLHSSDAFELHFMCSIALSDHCPKRSVGKRHPIRCFQQTSHSLYLVSAEHKIEMKFIIPLSL